MRRTGVLLALALAACTSNRRPSRVMASEPGNADVDPEASEETAAAAVPSAEGCSNVPRGAVCLAAGMSALGVDRGEGHFEERPPHAIRIDAFAIDRREVSTRAYHHCVSEGRCAPPSCELQRSSRVPVRCITQADAAAFCAWRNGRLPTEAEWERAAAGLLPTHRVYPWGEDLPETGLPRDITPEGIEALGGSLAEWVSDGGDFYPSLPRLRDASLDGDATADGALDADTDTATADDLPERTESGLWVLDAWRGNDRSPWRVARGGDDTLPAARRVTTLRRFRQPGDHLQWVGFRCAY